MDYFIETGPVEKLQCDCIIVGVYQDRQLTAAASIINDHCQDAISQVLERGDLSGKIGEALLLNWLPGQAFARILVVGLGENKRMTSKHYCKVLAAAAESLKKTAVQSVVVTLLDCTVANGGPQWQARQIVQAFSDSTYQYVFTKSDKNTDSKLASIVITAPENAQAFAQAGLAEGIAIAEGVSLAKHLGDLPGNICTPTYLAAQATEIAGQSPNMTVTILEEEDMVQLGMGSLLSVARGSRQPAKLIGLHYQGGDSHCKPIVLIGKGITFDAGGISLKPGLGMDEMKYDMCGAAAVLGTLQAAAQLQLPLNIVGLVPASENLPDGNANKPGDIWTSMSGKTIEILNTDAEGRLILCDTLTYAERMNPDVVIDLATLTGACLVALGRIPSGLLGNDDELCHALQIASEAANDSIWRLPLWEEYQELLQSNFADMANIGGKDAGTITAACFLARFAENLRWAHLDIAGTAWRTGPTKGATGRPVPLLCQYLLDRAAQVSA